MPVSKRHENKAPFDDGRHKKAPPVLDGAKWRRRESKEQARRRKDVTEQQLTSAGISLSGNCQENNVGQWFDLSSTGEELKGIIEAWPRISKSIRKEIVHLIS